MILTRALTPVGRLFGLGIDVVRLTFAPPFQLREFIEQAWFVTKRLRSCRRCWSRSRSAPSSPCSSATSPASSARSRSTGAAQRARDRQQAAPIVTALLIAGAGGSAICADLGARKIREEIDAMEVLGIEPVQRLVVPRVLAMAMPSPSCSTAWSSSSASRAATSSP